MAANYELQDHQNNLTPMQMKFAQLIVYGVEGIPITKTEAAKLAGLL